MSGVVAVSTSGGCDTNLCSVCGVPPPLDLLPIATSTPVRAGGDKSTNAAVLRRCVKNATRYKQTDGSDHESKNDEVSFVDALGDNEKEGGDEVGVNEDDDAPFDIPLLQARVHTDLPVFQHSGRSIDGFSSGVNDFAVEKYDFNHRLHHYMEYQPICLCNYWAVEYCCMVQANTIVCSNQQTQTKELHWKLMAEYLRLVEALPDSIFANHTIKPKMMVGYYGMRTKNGFKLDSFARKMSKVVPCVRLFLTQFPAAQDYSKLPSGTDLKDMKIAFIVNIWKKEKREQKQAMAVSFY